MSRDRCPLRDSLSREWLTAGTGRFRTTGEKVLELNPDLAAHLDAHGDPGALASDLTVSA